MHHFTKSFPPARNLARRSFLKASTSLAALFVFCRPSLAAKPISLNFLELSNFLTSRNNLNPHIAKRAYDALLAEDADFPRIAAHLQETIRAEKLKDMTQFADFSTRHPDLKTIAMKIISAWYLGYTGTPSMSILKDNARFVTYRNALMYEPTIDATVIPSFSRGHTNYWVNPPSSLSSD